MLPIVEGVLDAGLLVSSLSSIAIGPEETPQPIHADDQIIPLPKPHPPTVCNTMWALTDFTEANGATRLVPGTHLADESPDLGQLLRLHSRRDGARQRARLAWQPVARRRRQHHRCPARRHRHELLRRVHPPAGEPATRYSRWIPRAASPTGSRNSSATASTADSSATSTRAAPGRRLLADDRTSSMIWDSSTPPPQ